jgi:GNAT superfamily N-acetyltransferase
VSAEEQLNLPVPANAPPLRGLDFHGSPLATFEKDGERWVVMRPVVEGMGINWAGQQQKLAADPGRFNCMDIHTVGADGRTREMACIPLRRYPMWLATINPAKIPNPAVRQRVELYQDASAEALYQFWATGVADVETVAAAVREHEQAEPVGNVVQMPARRSFSEAMLAVRDAARQGSVPPVLRSIRDRVLPAVQAVTSTIHEATAGLHTRFNGMALYVQSKFSDTEARDAEQKLALEAVQSDVKEVLRFVRVPAKTAPVVERVTIGAALDRLDVPQDGRNKGLGRRLSHSLLTYCEANGIAVERQEQGAGNQRILFDATALVPWWEAQGRDLYAEQVHARG